jgi:hypothetical protein
MMLNSLLYPETLLHQYINPKSKTNKINKIKKICSCFIVVCDYKYDDIIGLIFQYLGSHVDTIIVQNIGY